MAATLPRFYTTTTLNITSPQKHTRQANIIRKGNLLPSHQNQASNPQSQCLRQNRNPLGDFPASPSQTRCHTRQHIIITKLNPTQCNHTRRGIPPTRPLARRQIPKLDNPTVTQQSINILHNQPKSITMTEPDGRRGWKTANDTTSSQAWSPRVTYHISRTICLIPDTQTLRQSKTPRHNRELGRIRKPARQAADSGVGSRSHHIMSVKIVF
jgi:hypothetical protein